LDGVLGGLQPRQLLGHGAVVLRRLGRRLLGPAHESARPAVKRTRTLTNGVLIAGFAVLCLAGIEFLAVNIGQPLPFGGGYSVHAVFSDADGIPTAADVRVSGVNVGRVTGVGHDPAYPGETVVTLDITDASAVPVSSDG